MSLYLEDMEGIVLIDRDTGIARQGAMTGFSYPKTKSLIITIGSSDTWISLGKKGKYRVILNNGGIGEWNNYSDELVTEFVSPRNIYGRVEKDKSDNAYKRLILNIDDESVKEGDALQFRVSYTDMDPANHITDDKPLWVFHGTDGYTEVGTLEDMADRMKAVFVYDDDYPPKALPGSIAISKDTSEVAFYGPDGTPSTI